MKKGLLNYAVAVLLVLLSPTLLIDVLQDENFNDRENLVVLISALTMFIIYSLGLVYIVGFCI